MKYSSSNKPLVCMLTTSTCYKNTSKMTPKGVLWHSTGANNEYIRRYVQPSNNDKNRANLLKILGKNAYGNDWNHIYYEAGVNAFIGKLADESVSTVQTLPWNYRPWGCGGGSKGSCNDGWIQFEICEASLSDKNYFNKVYKEACELTAYLCDMYNLNPNGTVTHNGVKVPVILCHADSYKLNLGSNHGDIYHWFNKHGKTMADVRKDVAALMKTTSSTTSKPTTTTSTSELYRVRKTWADAKSQIGAYKTLENAKKACKAGYKVFDSKGKVVYTPATTTTNSTSYKVLITADVLNVRSGAGTKYAVKTQIKKDGIYTISKASNGWGYIANKGWISLTYAKKINPYTAKVTADVLNVRSGAGTKYAIKTQIKQNSTHTIAYTSNNWGYIPNKGWVSLDYMKKV